MDKIKVNLMLSFKGVHFPKEIILMTIRWYLAYPLSYRHIEELMKERVASQPLIMFMVTTK